jgi:SpoVK/Ycf46/Vps4 family AAA+-type ATPase
VTANTLAAAPPAAVLQILGVHLQRRGLPLADDVSVEEIATMTMGFTGADLANLVNEVRASGGWLLESVFSV